MRFVNMILFLLVVTVGISWLNYWLLAKMFIWYRGRGIRIAYAVITLVTAAVMVLGIARRPPFSPGSSDAYMFLVYSAIVWFVGQICLLALQPVMAVGKRLLRQKDKNMVQSMPGQGMSRRVFLERALVLTPLLAAGVSAKGVYEAQAQLVVDRQRLPFNNLPSALNGFKIAQVTDTHLGPYFSIESMERVIGLLKEENPDLVVVTGDFADNMALVRPALERLDAYQPSVPYGMYYCYGNHDYFYDFNYLKGEVERSRIKVLHNQNALIVPGLQPFYLLGVDYPWGDEVGRGINVSADKRRQCFEAASQGVPANAFKMLIAHHPDFLFDGFAARIPLTVAGHTHGGQVVLGGRSFVGSYAYMRGMYRENGVYGYVDSGAGHWFPFRLGCPPQITLFTLQSKG